METLALKDNNTDKYKRQTNKKKPRVQRLTNIYVDMFFNKGDTESSKSV